MKIALFDQNDHDLNHLSTLILKNSELSRELFIFKFSNEDEFIQFLFKNISYSYFFINSESCQSTTLLIIKELYPDIPIILTTRNQTLRHLNDVKLLFKPYQLEDINRCIDYWLTYHNHSRFIKVYDQDHYLHIPVQDIYYLESYYGQVHVHLKDQEYIACQKELYKYENKLEHLDFLSIHKSILINYHKIKKASLFQYHLLNDVILIPSSRKKSSAFKKYLDLLDTKAY